MKQPLSDELFAAKLRQDENIRLAIRRVHFEYIIGIAVAIAMAGAWVLVRKLFE